MDSSEKTCAFCCNLRNAGQNSNLPRSLSAWSNMLVALVVDLRNLVGERRFVYLVDSILECSRSRAKNMVLPKTLNKFHCIYRTLRNKND